MSKPIVRVYSAPGKFVDREMNSTEFSQYEADQAANEARLAEAATKAIQRQAILDRLGLTEDEARLLLG
jgi:hypothetical protein